MELETVTESFDVVPTHLAVAAMRDNGYRNAAYAIAELIDNSIQAGATTVELICSEQTEQLSTRQRKRISRVAVLDNGRGMNSESLRKALQFGNGTRLDDRTGMGRFGMGLPSSSISQCRRVEVWTWQSGPESALFSYLDLGEIERRETAQVPAPKPLAIPDFWLKSGESFGKSGTLVVWSALDRCMWKTAHAIIKNSEYIIGRMYRSFIHKGDVLIKMVSVNVDDPRDKKIEIAIPNDPLYLMSPTSCPEPFHNVPMFEIFGDSLEIEFKIEHNGQQHPVWLRFSLAKEEARTGDNAGSTAHGLHAARNIGVSIVRAGRELELSQSWVIKDARERWWGVEVEFPPALDEVFGVSNNKQSARNLADAGALDIENFLAGRTVQEAKDDMDSEGDPMAAIFDLAKRIKDTLQQIRILLKNQGEGKRAYRRKRHLESNSPESLATKGAEQRRADGFVSQSDKDDSIPSEERQEAIEQILLEQGQTVEVAKELAASTVSHGLKYVFGQDEVEGAAFFSVRIKAGTIFITLNTKHPAYQNLVESLESEDENASVEDLKNRLASASNGLRLLLGAWARLEDETEAGDAREKLVDIRTDWGRVARRFLAAGG